VPLAKRWQKSRVKNPDCRRRNSGYVAVVNWQTVISLGIVSLAATSLLWGRLRHRKFSFARDTHCGCAGNEHVPNTSSIVFHVRKGERPKILVKNQRQHLQARFN
jgi:hypothetical protein